MDGVDIDVDVDVVGRVDGGGKERTMQTQAGTSSAVASYIAFALRHDAYHGIYECILLSHVLFFDAIILCVLDGFLFAFRLSSCGPLSSLGPYNSAG